MQKQNLASITIKETYNYNNSNFFHAHNLLTPIDQTKQSIVQNETISTNNNFISEQLKKAKSDQKSQLTSSNNIPTVQLKNQFDIVDMVQQTKLKKQAYAKFQGDRKFQQLQIGKVREDVSHYYDQLKSQTSREQRMYTLKSKRDHSVSKSRSNIRLINMKNYQILEENLSQELKCFNSEAPSSRVQSIKLKEWFNSQKQNTSIEILQITIKELINQVKKDCFERGQLLQDIWNKVLDQLGDYKFQMEIKVQQNEIKSLDEYSNVHKLYKNQITSFQEQIKQLTQQLEKSQNLERESQKELQEVDTLYKKSRNKLNDVQKISHYLQKNLKQAHYEIDLLNKKLLTYQAQNQRIKKSHILNKSDSIRSPQILINNHPVQTDSESEQDLIEGLLDDKNIVEMDNMVMNMDKIIKVQCESTEIDAEFRELYYRNVETQTELNLMNSQMDCIFDSQQKVNQLLEQYLSRKQVMESLKVIEDHPQKPLFCRSKQLSIMIEQNFFEKKQNEQHQTEHDLFVHKNNIQNQRPIQSTRDLDQESKRQSQQDVDLEKIRQLIVIVQDKDKQIQTQKDIIDQMSQQCQVHLLQLEDAKLRSVSINAQQQFRDAKKEIEKEEQILDQFLSSENLKTEQQIFVRKNQTQKTKIQNQQRYLFKGPQLGQKVKVEYEFQKLNAGPQLIEKIKLKQLPKIKHFMPLKLLLKQISVIYQDRIQQQKENQMIRDQDMASFVYHYFLQQFGIKKIAEQKFLILVVSVKHHKSIVRVNVFAKFLGLFDQYINYSIDEMKKYLEAFDYVTNISQLGQNIPDQESEIRYMVGYLRAVQYIGLFADSRMTLEEKEELKKELELLKEIDQKKQIVIDFDQFMIQMFVKYKILVSRAKEYVINAFAACDLDGNNMCNFEEWYLLLRHIEPDRLSHDQITEIFFTNADLIVKGEQNFSFEKFAVICVEYGLFSEEAQNNFLKCKGTKTEILVQFQRLIEQWPLIRKEIQSKFDEITLLDAERQDHWREIIETLESKLSELKSHLTQQGIEKKAKPLLIANLLLQKETELLLELQKEYQEDAKIASSNNSIQINFEQLKQQ